MGLQRVIINGWGTEDLAVEVAGEAKELASRRLMVTKVTVVSHPGEADEKTTVVYSVG